VNKLNKQTQYQTLYHQQEGELVLFTVLAKGVYRDRTGPREKNEMPLSNSKVRAGRNVLFVSDVRHTSPPPLKPLSPQANLTKLILYLHSYIIPGLRKVD